MNEADVKTFDFLDQETQKCRELKRVSFLSLKILCRLEDLFPYSFLFVVTDVYKLLLEYLRHRTVMISLFGSLTF